MTSISKPTRAASCAFCVPFPFRMIDIRHPRHPLKDCCFFVSSSDIVLAEFLLTTNSANIAIEEKVLAILFREALDLG
jgi:hypothetical protein